MKIELSLPLRDIYVTQPFGVNYVGFYKKLGLLAHNGIDFKARIGARLLAAHDGIVTYANTDSGGGKCVIISSTVEGAGYKTIYYHLSEIKVKNGDIVEAGKVIGKTGNTGKYTTGPHLHFGLKKIFDGATINTKNGYKGAIDPSLYFKKNWDKSNAYHRYGRKGNWLAEFKVRFKNPWLHRQLIKAHQIKKIYNNEAMNMLIYGGWGYEDMMNPAMWENCAYLKKDEYTRGLRPFT